MEENERHCICLHSPPSNRMVCCNVCDTWYHMESKELDHTFAHSNNFYVCNFCIRNTFTDIFQYLRCSIKLCLNNNSGDPVVALLNNLALLSKSETRRFTLLTLSVQKKLKKSIFKTPVIQPNLNKHE